MKKVLAVVLAVLMLVGCQSIEEKTKNDERQKVVGKSRFYTVENNMQWRIVVDRETKVMYAVSFSTHNIGVFTLLVDADGKPLIWKGETE